MSSCESRIEAPDASARCTPHCGIGPTRVQTLAEMTIGGYLSVWGSFHSTPDSISRILMSTGESPLFLLPEAQKLRSAHVAELELELEPEPGRPARYIVSQIIVNL